MHHSLYKRSIFLALVGVVLLATASCGSSDGGSTTAAPPAPAPTTLAWDQGNWGAVNWQ
jgi:hypothetical protein